VLAPAVMQLLGRANWWIPRWRDRALPQLDGDVVHAQVAAERA
jgi:putative drug exporter of the RND superfamily